MKIHVIFILPEFVSFGDDPNAGLGVPLGLLKAVTDVCDTLEGGLGKAFSELEIFSR